MRDEQLRAEIAAAVEQAKADLRSEIAPSIAEGLRVAAAKPVGESGAATLGYGEVIGVGDGYADVRLDGDVEATPVATLGTLGTVAIGQRVSVMFQPPSGALVMSAVGAGSGGTAPEIPVPLSTGRPWTMEPIVRSGDGQPMSSFNGGGFAQDYTLVEPDGSVYVLFYGPALRPFIARKKPGYLDWEVCDIASLPGNPLSQPITLDGHNFTVFGIDGEDFGGAGMGGRVHIAGNFHASPLHYLRSTKGVNDPTFNWSSDWTGDIAMNGINETNCTYPMFHRLPSGTLLFFYRAGSSGDGDQYCKRFVSGAWQDIADGTGNKKITDGETDGISAYLLPPVIGQDGTSIHMMFNWRITGTANTNEGWYYAKLTGVDAGGTLAAERSDGSVITLPIRRQGSGAPFPRWAEKIASFSAPYILNDAAPGAFHPCDPAGHPHSSFMSIDGIGAPQHYHLFRDTTGWHCDQITTHGPWIPAADWSDSTPAGDSSRMKIVSTPDGRTLAIGRFPLEGKRGKLWCYDLTHRDAEHGFAVNTGLGVGALPTNFEPSGYWLTKTVNQSFPIDAFPDQGDFHYNYQDIANNKLTMLITSSSQRFYHDPGINDVDDVGYGVPNVDPTKRLGPSSEPIPGGLDANGDPINWGHPNMEAPGGICSLYTVDLAQLDRFRDREVILPTIKTVSESTGGNIPVARGAGGATTEFTPAGDLLQFHRQSVWASTSSGGAVTENVIAFEHEASGGALGNFGDGNQPSIIIPSTYSGSLLFGRMFVQMRLEPTESANTGWVAACMVQSRAIQLSPSHGQISEMRLGNVRAVGLSAEQTTIPFTGITAFPSYPFVVQIDNESLNVLSLQSGTSTTGVWNVTRGYNGTTASLHAVNSPIFFVVASAFNTGVCWNEWGPPGASVGGSNVSQSPYSESTVFTTSWCALRQFWDVPGSFGGYLGRLRSAMRSGDNPAGARGFVTSITLQLGVLE